MRGSDGAEYEDYFPMDVMPSSLKNCQPHFEGMNSSHFSVEAILSKQQA
jgi:hypothetical protein